MAGGRSPESELSCKYTTRSRAHWEREGGMEPLKLLEWRLSLRRSRRLASWSLSRPARWRRGKLSCRTWLSSEQTTPRQSQGADGVDESQPLRAPSGSRRLSLNDIKAWISDTTAPPGIGS